MRLGVFDSGVGGLTVLTALRQSLPTTDLVYLGDTARVPYGTRSPQTVRTYALRVASYLVHDQDVDGLVIACNTATTHALPQLVALAKPLGLPVYGVVDPGVRAALALHKSGAIAVLGTESTIHGGAYHRALARQAPGVPLVSTACPLFVPLVEEGWLTGEVPKRVAERYLVPLRGRVRTAILGCTHYPLLRDVIQGVLPDVTLVDSAATTAMAVAASLGDRATGSGHTSYLVTDHCERFQEVSRLFLGARPAVQWVDLPDPQGAFANAIGEMP